MPAETAPALRQARLVESELQQLVYAISHNLPEPLRIVSGYSDLLQNCDAIQADRKSAKYLSYIVDGAQRMQRMLDATLEYSRVSTHGAPFATLNMTRLVQSIVRMHTRRIADAKATVDVSELPEAFGDAGQIQSVLFQLLHNALKFRRDPCKIRIQGIRGTDDMSTFSVEDNGIGIDMSDPDRPFGIFQRLCDREAYPGVGAGLAIVQRVIHRHGGTLWCHSPTPRGSTLFFTLPTGKARTDTP